MDSAINIYTNNSLSHTPAFRHRPDRPGKQPTQPSHQTIRVNKRTLLVFLELLETKKVVPRAMVGQIVGGLASYIMDVAGLQEWWGRKKKRLASMSGGRGGGDTVF